MSDKPPANEDKKPSVFAVIASVFAAVFGVQSSKNRERDFKHGKFRNYVITAVVFVLLFIATVTTIVRVVLSEAG